MKFAKTLEQDCVPEWRVKYVDYRAGKKYVKNVTRAVQRAKGTNRVAPRSTPPSAHKSLYGATSSAIPTRSPRRFGPNTISDGNEPLNLSPRSSASEIRPSSLPVESCRIPAAPLLKAQPIDSRRSQDDGLSVTKTTSRQTLELPEPALTEDVQGSNAPSPVSASEALRATQAVPPPDVQKNAYEVGRPSSPAKSRFPALRRLSRGNDGRPLIRRLFSVGMPLLQADKGPDINMMNIDHIREQQSEFFSFMNKELQKVESFYKEKEDAAGARLNTLREQLHEMRDRKLHEDSEAQQNKDSIQNAKANGHGLKGRSSSGDQLQALLNPFNKLVDQAKSNFPGHHPASSTKALREMGTPVGSGHTNPNDRGDYARRPQTQDIPYKSARRKLKVALLEFYRGMELLKSYALLNRTAFSKIHKKYDKAIDAHPPLRYMTETIDKAWFVRSDILDGHMRAVEDLFARYFEKGNRKVATGKLRASLGRSEDQSMTTFTNGLMIGIGAVFTIHGIIYGTRLLDNEDPVVRIQTNYLMQIYGGYLLTLYLFFWFCFDCRVWTKNKINYPFIFEFDPRHALDWRELSAFPSFFLLIFGVCIWLNFSRYSTQALFIYYPVVLIAITVLIIFIPARVLFYRSRKWLIHSHGRLLLAGLFPVEFRDFLLGDMYCSLTYVTANIELFFCLYAHHWDNPPQCNSSHSRLMGFLACMPAIWRSLQCIRRYYDTRNIFPHLVNCGKYLMTIAYYVSLSLYRIQRSRRLLITFSILATLNGIYVSVWDLVMDWSLLQPQSKKRFLRDVRGFKQTWPYYLAIFVDPLLRFNWIFYSIYTHDLQHSTPASFFVAFSEISRRGMWAIFRVENEHCSNVARFKASRDVPLPYDLEHGAQIEHTHANEESDTEPTQSSPMLSRIRSSTGARVAPQKSSTSSLRRRVARTRTLTDVLADAHTQDFEKKRRPEVIADEDEPNDTIQDDERPESDDDEADHQDVLDAEALLRERMKREAEG